MAKTRNEAPPGGDAGGIFDKDNKPTLETYPEAPAEPVKEPGKPPEPKAEGPRTTRGMNPVLTAADKVWKVLSDLEPGERQWVWLFTMTQFPDLTPSGTK